MHLPWRAIEVDGHPILTSLTDNEAAKLRSLAPGQRILEVGSAYGFSACVMGLAGPESILAVDPHTWIAGSGGTMAANLDRYGLSEKVEIRSKTFYAVAPALVAAKAKFSFIFIDGDHSYSAIHYDATEALKLIEPGGTIAVHDVEETCCCPDVKRAVAATLGDPDEMVDTMAVFSL
jgi:predicted O-methyltransferase YrrM